MTSRSLYFKVVTVFQQSRRIQQQIIIKIFIYVQEELQTYLLYIQ